MDSTCLSAHIHYPVDWVLLRDGTRTLTKAIQLIRDHGLKHRMPAPESFPVAWSWPCSRLFSGEIYKH